MDAEDEEPTGNEEMQDDGLEYCPKRLEIFDPLKRADLAAKLEVGARYMEEKYKKTVYFEEYEWYDL